MTEPSYVWFTNTRYGLSLCVKYVCANSVVGWVYRYIERRIHEFVTWYDALFVVFVMYIIGCLFRELRLLAIRVPCRSD